MRYRIANISSKLALEESHDDPKATTVVVVVGDERLAIAHIGDSRAYRLSVGADEWCTRDHSAVQRLLDQGSITEDEMARHPEQGQLLKSVGARGDAAPSVSIQPPLGPGDAMLLCTDGFWEYVTAEQRQNLLRATSLHTSLQTLALAATTRAQGKSDNLTALCARVASLATALD